MNFELDEEQTMLKTAARDFLEKECPKKLVRDMMEDDKGYSASGLGLVEFPSRR